MGRFFFNIPGMMHIDYIDELKKPNRPFIERTGKDFFKDLQDGQKPYMTLVTCSDSRVQTEALEHSAINKIFIIRNIGNQIYSNEGSVDYGVLHLKTPILLILGHSDCGAIKAFLAGYKNEPSSIKSELDHLIPVISNKNLSLFEHVLNNIQYQVNLATEKYEDLISSKKLMVIGALYDFHNELQEGYGKVKIISINGKPE